MREAYAQILAEVRSDVEHALSIHRGGRARAYNLAAYVRLRQTCCDPDWCLVKRKVPKSPRKTRSFRRNHQECIASNRRVVVFSRFIKMQEIIHEVLKEEGIENALWLRGVEKSG